MTKTIFFGKFAESAHTFCAIRLCLLLSLFLLELHVPIVHDSPCQLVDGRLLISSEAQDVNGTLETEVVKEMYVLQLLPTR